MAGGSSITQISYDIIPHNKINNLIQAECASKDPQSWIIRPIVFCNTLATHRYMDQLAKLQIEDIYWIIHEWLSPDYGFKNFKLRNLNVFQIPKKLIFVCESSYKNYKNTIQMKDHEIIYNGIDLADIETRSQLKVERDISIPSGSIIICIIGVINRSKNQQNFINDVFYRLQDHYGNLKLLLLGKEMTSLNILEKYQKDIIILGEIGNVFPYLILSDILVSYSNREVFPLNIMEAMACKKPIVSVNVGGIKEIIDHDINGFLINPGNWSSCQVYLKNLIDDAALRTSIGNQAYQKIQQYQLKYSLEKYAKLVTDH